MSTNMHNGIDTLIGIHDILDIDSHEASKILERLDGFFIQRQLYNAGIKEIRTKIEILDAQYKVLTGHSPIHHIEDRMKTPISIMKKLQKKGFEISLDSIWKNVHDVAGIRVVCNYRHDIYSIRNLLLKQNDVTLVAEHDYVSKPKENGYRSLHLIISVPIFLSETIENVKVEVQIRTIAMDFWATLEHQVRYKSQRSDEITDDIMQRLFKSSESIADIDDEMEAIYNTVFGKDKPQN